MKMQDVLREHVLNFGDLACYDKSPGRAYILDDEIVFEIKASRRVLVPMRDVALMKTSPDDLLFALLQCVAELGSRVAYTGAFDSIRAYFTARDLPLATVVKHPILRLQLPDGVGVLEWEGAPKDRFYCLTSADLLGRTPVRFPGTYAEGLDAPTSMEQRGFVILTPDGILTAFVEA